MELTEMHQKRIRVKEIKTLLENESLGLFERADLMGEAQELEDELNQVVRQATEYGTCDNCSG